jgi:hypothetical protein
MDVKEALQFTDQLIFQQTGKHLDDLQKSVIEGTWERQTYQEIAQKSKLSEKHISDVAYHLWELLSEALGEDIKKSNFRSTLERVYIESSPNSLLNIFNVNSDNNFDHTQILNNAHQPIQEKAQNNDFKSVIHDLILAPQIIKFYNREIELEKLNHWIFNKHNRLISVLGLSGIGKTTLVKRFVDLNLDQFEVIIWKNLKFSHSFNEIIREILANYSECSDVKFYVPTEVCQILNLLKEKKCLIIFDNVENIFISGQFAGQYKPEYQDFQNFFKLITESEHQSNIILISQEKSAEMQCLNEELYPIKYLEISGLNNINILENTGLKDQGSWLKLIKLYQENPFYLKEIAILIKNIFDGKVAEFLTENNLIITQNIQAHFHQIFNRLSVIEQVIILELSKFEQPVTREELKENLDLASLDFLNGLQSLQQRYLITKIEQEQILFNLSPLFKEYLKLISR